MKTIFYGHNYTFFQIYYVIIFEKNAHEISLKICGITTFNYGRDEQIILTPTVYEN